MSARRWTVGRMVKASGLVGYFFWELVVSNVRVAVEVLSPRYRMRPGIIGGANWGGAAFDAMARSSSARRTWYCATRSSCS